MDKMRTLNLRAPKLPSNFVVLERLCQVWDLGIVEAGAWLKLGQVVWLRIPSPVALRGVGQDRKSPGLARSSNWGPARRGAGCRVRATEKVLAWGEAWCLQSAHASAG